MQMSVRIKYALYIGLIMLLAIGCGDDCNNVVCPDSTPPMKVTDLAAISVSDSSILLTWTAPGDNGEEGKASEYEIRYSTLPATIANWWDSVALKYDIPPVPQLAGAAESLTVSGLTAMTPYYFGLKAADDAVNWSDISAIASATPGKFVLLVKPDGTGAYPTIQEAIDAAADGDFIELADGIFTGEGNRDIDFRGKAITVQSQNGDPNTCTIDCEGSEVEPHRGFHFQSSEGKFSILEGVTITNGHATFGGAVLCEGNSSPTFQNCVFRENSVSGHIRSSGGALYCDAVSSPMFDNCDFIENEGPEGQDAFPQGGGAIFCEWTSVLTMNKCNFMDNSACEGGAINCLGNPSITIIDCSFSGNRARDGWGGAIICGAINSQAGEFLDITTSTFSDNSATGQGGAVFYMGSSLSISGCMFLNNKLAGSTGATRMGGGLSCTSPINSGSSVDITNCRFEGNSALDYGGGISINYPDGECLVSNCMFLSNNANNGGAIHINKTTEASIADCEFESNQASHGGASHFLNSSPVISRCIYSSNVAAEGGTIYCWSASPLFNNCTMVGNSGLLSEGAIIHCMGTSSPVLENCIIMLDPGLGGEAFTCADESIPILTCCLLHSRWNAWTGCIEDQYGLRGNLAGDPLFCDLDNRDYRLEAASPCNPDSSSCGLIGAMPVGCE